MTPSIKTVILTSLILLLLASCATSRQSPPPAGDDPGKQLYDAGRAALLERDYPQAIDRFRTLVALHPDTAFTPQARMELAYSYYKLGDALSAIAAAERFIRDYPNHPTVDYLYYLRGLAAYEHSIAFLEQQAQEDEPATPPLAALTLQYFNTLIERFPASKYSADARSRLAHLQDGLARIEVQRAKRALARGDYASASLHARAVMEKYPESLHSRQAAALADMSSRALQPSAAAAGALLDSTAADSANTPPPPSDDHPPARTSRPPQKPLAPMAETRAAEVAIRQQTADDGPHGEDWLLAQEANAFTLQLLGTGKRQALLAFIERHALRDQAAYFSTEREGRPWYTLVYGIYPDRRSAQAAAAALAEKLRALHPWTRSLGSIQAVIRAARQAAARP